jgi:hypothetical protein
MQSLRRGAVQRTISCRRASPRSAPGDREARATRKTRQLVAIAGYPPPADHDAETELVIAANRVFEDAALDVATNARVISYLRDRYTASETE